MRAAHKDGTYERLLAMQEGRCGICRRRPEESCLIKKTGKLRRFDIDVDHAHMIIRGLLCRGCNMRLRKDHRAGWLRGAANYLDFPPARLLSRSP